MTSYKFILPSITGPQEVKIHSDGTLEMPGFDIEYEKALVEFGEDLSPAYILYSSWDRLTEYIDVVSRMNDISYDDFCLFFSQCPDFFEHNALLAYKNINFQDILKVVTAMLENAFGSGNEKQCLTIAGFVKKLKRIHRYLVRIDAYSAYTREINRWTTEIAEDHSLILFDDEVLIPWKKYARCKIVDIFDFHTNTYSVPGEQEIDSARFELLQNIVSKLHADDPAAFPNTRSDEPRIPSPLDSGVCGHWALMYIRLKPFRPTPYEQNWDVALVQYPDLDELDHAFEVASGVDAENGHLYDILKMRRIPSDEVQCQAWQDMTEKERRTAGNFFDWIAREWEEIESWV